MFFALGKFLSTLECSLSPKKSPRSVDWKSVYLAPSCSNRPSPHSRSSDDSHPEQIWERTETNRGRYNRQHYQQIKWCKDFFYQQLCQPKLKQCHYLNPGKKSFQNDGICIKLHPEKKVFPLKWLSNFAGVEYAFKKKRCVFFAFITSAGGFLHLALCFLIRLGGFQEGLANRNRQTDAMLCFRKLSFSCGGLPVGPRLSHCLIPNFDNLWISGIFSLVTLG